MGNYPTYETIGENWIKSGEWARWSAPYKLVVGESKFHASFEALVEPPSENDTYIPVVVEFVRESKTDPCLYRAMVYGHQVGLLMRATAEHISAAKDCPGRIACPGVIQFGFSGRDGDVIWSCHVWPLDEHIRSWPGLNNERVGNWDFDLTNSPKRTNPPATSDGWPPICSGKSVLFLHHNNSRGLHLWISKGGKTALTGTTLRSAEASSLATCLTRAWKEHQDYRSDLIGGGSGWVSVSRTEGYVFLVATEGRKSPKVFQVSTQEQYQEILKRLCAPIP